MNETPIPYWMAFAHAKNFSNKRKMDFLIEVVYNKEPIEEVFRKIKSGDKMGFDFTEKEWEGLLEAINEIPNNSFLAEKLLDQGIEIVNVMEQYAYPKILKENLKKDAPIVIYTKGNADLLNKNSIAIVGSRNCSKKSLDFTDNVAKKAVAQKSVIVSGFAKGVDKQALDSALKFNGQSIIVLPQGIETFNNKSYYAAIVRGDVLVISTYHPKTPWSVGLAMDRNKIIYGLAKEIYVAESGDSGGTWEGVLNGIKRGRQVFIRFASNDEKNANNLLIKKGAIPVDMTGKAIELEKASQLTVNEPETQYQELEIHKFSDKEIVEKVMQELNLRKIKGITVNEIIELFNLKKKDSTRINKLLTKHPDLTKTKKGRVNCFLLKNQLPQQTSIIYE